MMIIKSIAAAALLLLFLQAAAQEEEECGVYLAESSTSQDNDPKWGLYAGMTLPENHVVPHPDIAIQTHNMVGNSRPKSSLEAEDLEFKEQVVDFFEQFIWVPDSSGGRFELAQGRTVSAIPGAGVLGCYNAELTNSDWSHGEAYFRSNVGEEPLVAHPGRGAYSNFYNVTQKTKHTIPAGMEIFVDYGENYQQEKANENELSRKDFERIDNVVDSIIDFYNEYGEEMSDEIKRDVYNFLIQDVVGAAAGPKKARKITNILPTDPDGLVELKKKGGTFLADKSHVFRQQEWLQENGLCMDNIKMGASTIAHAGRGAFATRSISKGGLVSPIPLIHLPDKSILDMHEIGKIINEEDDTPFYYKASDEVIGKQLLTNYCLGHAESSMVFFPAGSAAAFINHSSKPNAKLTWSSHYKHHPEWFDLPLEDLMLEENQYVGLLMEVVATRNIKEGEEVFIDYGKEWENAWKEHVKTWEKKVKEGEIDSVWPLRALDMNQAYKNGNFKTPEELEKDPYPDNVQLMCFLVVEEATDDDEDKDGIKHRKWTMPEKGTAIDTDHLYECKVLECQKVENEAFNYTVLWGENSESETIVEQVPHDAIVFVDKAGTGDQFVQHAFRHTIGIPDDVFPKGPWRDLAEK